MRRVRILAGLVAGAMTLGGCAGAPAATPGGGQLTWIAGRIVPRFEKIRTLRILTVPAATSANEQVALATLEGLVNDPRPRLYVEAVSGDVFWAQHALPGVQQVPLSVPATVPQACGTQTQATLFLPHVRLLCAALRAFPGVVKGLVIDDPSVSASIDVATTLASQDHALVVSPAEASFFEAAPFHLKVLTNLQNEHWSSNLQAYTWAFNNLWAKADHRLLFSLDPSISMNLREYAVATHGFVFWLHPSRSDEAALLRQILKAAPADAPVLGWWTNEPAGVGLASQYQHFTVATDFMNNLSVFSAFPSVTGLKQTPAGALPKLANKVYYSVQFSDGDNLQFMQHRLRQLWQDPQRAKVPLAFTVQPWAAQLAPTILSYYYRTASTNDLFVTGPSGPGYFYPQDWPATALPSLLRLGLPVLRADDLTDIEVWNYNALDLGDYASILHPQALLLGNGGVGGITESNGVPMVDNVGQPDTVAQAASMLSPFAGSATAPTGPNLAQGLRPQLGSAAPAGSALRGDGATFPAAPSGAPDPSQGVSWTIAGTEANTTYQVSAQVSGTGSIAALLGPQGQTQGQAVNLTATPQTVSQDITIPQAGVPLVVAAVPYGGAATVHVSGLSVQRLQAAALSKPVFVNLYVDAWTFTPTMVSQLEQQLGSNFRLVRLDQLVRLWQAAQTQG